MKTKHLFLTAILLVFSMLAVAEPVDPMRALEVAEQFAPQSAKAKRIKSKTAHEQSYEIVYTHRMPNSDRVAFYVVSLGEKGFVIISADDVANPILGYSYTNSWPTSVSAEGDTLLPPQVLSFLNNMALQIETAIEKYPNLESSEKWNNVGQKTVRKTSARKSADALPDSVGPLLTTTWGQGQYYNALCPEDANGEDGHVQTGCVATAMAQIIHYWGQKEEIKTRGIHSYDSQYGNLTVNYDSTSYDFTNMPDALTAESTPEQINAVAKLMYECGVAVNMQYSTWESSAQNADARAALINFYHFTPDLSIAERAYFSSVEWDNLLHNDIAQGKPVYYSGAQNNLGHSFVCDGYNATGYYHFNFGWGGLADGWYLTSAVSPIGMDYSSNQLVLVGIVPDNTSNVILGQTTGNSVFKVDEPLEFYHLLGHNAYEGTNYMNECNNHVLFKSADNATQLVLDILEHKDQNATVCDGEWGAELRSLYAGQENDLSPIVSTNNALQINYSGNLYYSGFHFAISRDEGCRRVSNIVTSADTTTIHLTWQENGNATQWEIEYGESGFTIGEGIRQKVSTTQYDIVGLKKLTEYDIYIRSICGAKEYGEWNKVTITTKALYWIDVIKTQPNGFKIDLAVLDNSGCHPIIISSAEGLAWWAKNVISGEIDIRSTINLIEDIDLGAFLWKPIPEYYGNFNGNGHTISNMKIFEDGDNSENYGWGFFAMYRGYNDIELQTISNLYFQNPHIKCRNVNSYNHDEAIYVKGSGVIAGRAFCTIIKNCGVKNGTLIQEYATSGDGMLVGFSESDIKIINSYASGCIISSTYYVGGLIGCMLGKDSSIENCYSSCRISTLHGEAGGIASYVRGGNIHSVYGVENDFPLIRTYDSAYGNILDTLQFNPVTQQLNGKIYIDGIGYSDLLTALNKKVKDVNDCSWREWNSDISGMNKGYPVLGDYFFITCPNVENVVARSVETSSGYAIRISWDSSSLIEGMWRVKYWKVNTSDTTATYINVNKNTIEINDLEPLQTYNICIRFYCDINNYSGWGIPLQVTFDKPYWTDIVTTKPDGYIENDEGVVIISTEEGLAWFSSLVNGLNGEESRTFAEKTIMLVADLDMSRFKWLPIGSNSNDAHTFQGSFNGNNHIISNLYINENRESVGLFGHIHQCNSISSCKIRNLILSFCSITGDSKVGGILGSYHSNEISPLVLLDNCHVYNGSITGTKQCVGALIGYHGGWGDIVIKNCSSSGSLYGEDGVGGLVGSLQLNNGLIGYITNNYSICTINATSLSGGLVGFLGNSHILNNYTASTMIAPNNMDNGNAIGSLCSSLSNYIYASENNTYLPIVGEVTASSVFDMDNNSLFSSIGLLSSPIMINDKSYLNLLDALNAWVDANNSEGQYLHWVADTAGVNGGYPILKQESIELPKYIVTFSNDDGTILQQDTLELGAMPAYRGDTPTKESTAQYTYTFTGWSPELDVVTGHASYYAQYESTLNQYEVTFYNWDGTLLQSELVNYGDMPVYTGVTPTRESDAQYTYTFTGWSPGLSMVTGHQSYYAQYEATLNQYEVTFLNWDGSVLQSTMVNYGEMPSYTSAAPTRESDAQYTYTFTGWSPGLSMVTGHQSYYAQYEATLNQYEITFYDWDSTLLQSEWVNYGEMPSYNGITPTKPEDEQYIYTFLGWEPEITLVIDNAAYTAVYEAVEKVGSSIDDITTGTNKPRKVYIEGKLFIIIGDSIYSGQGHRIK